MYNLLLVDDELPVLEGLKCALDWSEYGFKQVYTSQCAEDAMQIMKEHRIDLLILDILMPGMNGLEMLRAIRTRHPQTHCILISAHSKFEYAREALRLNVENYLLKPIDMNELQETVYRAVENIARESADLHNLFERNMLERWLYGRITNDELLEHSRFTGYNVLMRRYYALLIQTQGDIRQALRSLSTQLQPHLPAYELVIDDSTGVILTGGRDINSQLLEELASGITAAHPAMRIICGSSATGSSEVSKSLADANHAMEYARLAGLTGFIDYDAVNWSLLTPEMRTELADLVQSAQAPRKISEWAGQMPDDTGDLTLRTTYAHICLELMHILDETDQQSSSLPAIPSPCAKKRFLAAIEQAVEFLCRTRQERMNALSPIVQLVIKYINDNITTSLSIKQFCEQSKTNAAYIGRLFKEETGMYFSDYVNMLRINKAKLLLETSDLSVSDIARKVGVYDVSYFTQRFKKQVRMSPMKYRQSCQQQAGEQ